MEKKKNKERRITKKVFKKDSQKKISEKKEFEEIDQLRIDSHLPFADSLIFFIAKKEGGFFVTSDSHHFLSNKPLKEKYESEIKIVSPNKALRIMNEYLKKLRKNNSKV